MRKCKKTISEIILDCATQSTVQGPVLFSFVVQAVCLYDLTT